MKTSRRAARRGFTIVEMLFAMIVLSIGLLALAGLALATSRMTRGGSIQTVASALAQARFDSIASLPCQPLWTAGTTRGTPPAFRGIRESWVVTAGPARLNLVDTLRVPGRTRPLVYQNVLPCR